MESVKEDFHNSGLVNQLREIIEDHWKTQKILEDITHHSNLYCDPLCKDYKYAKRDLQDLRAEANLLKVQMDRHSGAVNAPTKNSEDLLVELQEQRELKKSIPAFT